MTITPVRDARELRSFIRLPWRLHRHHALWVPPLLRDEQRFFDPGRNRGFGYSDVTLALAASGTEVIGRVMGIVNRRYNERSGERTARFGYLESPNDGSVAQALLRHVEDWARNLGMRKLVGPMGFTDQDPEGLLVEGFEHSPTIATYYNFEYLPPLLEGLGYAKEVDYVVYRVPVPDSLPRVYELAMRRTLGRGQLRLVEFGRRSEMRRWVRPIIELLSDTFDGLYGFVPPDPTEVADLTRQWLPVLDPRFVKVVAHGDRPVGFLLAMPHLADGLRSAGGRLFPFGFLKVMLAARRSRQLDLLVGGIRAEFRGRGVDALMGAGMMREARAAGFEWIDSHHELEANVLVRAEMERVGGQLYKRYRIYAKPLVTDVARPEASRMASRERIQTAGASPAWHERAIRSGLVGTLLSVEEDTLVLKIDGSEQSILTRDAVRFRSYFPKVGLIAPDRA